MERDLHACPSFLKLLMEDDFRKEIRIPNAFMRDFKNKLSRKCVLKGTTAKKSWPVRICRKHNHYYICKRAWPNFVKDHKLKYGDYLLFWLVKKTTLKVIPYGADCTRKSEVSYYEEYDPSSSSDDEFDSSEEDDIDEEDEGVDDDEDYVDEDDDLDPSKGHSAKNAKYKKRRVDSGRSNNESQKSKQSKNSGIQVKEENETEREETTDAMDGYYETNLENPYFIIQVKPSHLCWMTILNKFAKETKLNLKENFVLHGEDDREWPVKICANHGRVFIGKGWSNFCRAYRLKVGETCKFTLLKSLGNVFHVEIVRP